MPMAEFRNVRPNGPWTSVEIASFLSGAIIPLRLAVLNGDGWPLVASLWFLPGDEALWCATRGSALIVRHLREDGRCAFEVAGDAPPYRGVRGQAVATLHADKGEEILQGLLRRYAIRPESRLSRTLLERAKDEIAIRIEPEWITSWDFTERMKDSRADPSRL